MPEAHLRRREALRAQLRHLELDAILLVNLRNIRYLTGFTGSNAALLVDATGEANTVFCTDGRYLTQSETQVPELDRVIDRSCDLALMERADKQGYRRLGFESHTVTVEQRQALAEVSRTVALHNAPYLVEELRQVKDEAEVEALRMACAIADRALAELIEHGGLRTGRTERAVARELENRMLDLGANGVAFETIVATGVNSAIPHHQPDETELRTGDLLKIDFGAQVDGYHSDMTRTMVLGAAADWQRELYQLVSLAQAAGRAALAPGVAAKEVDAAARDVIVAAGHGSEFLHGLGHGVGLEIHEAPALSKTGTARLSAGMAVTVEPGVYFAGRGGVRIEDTLVVREGAPELLTLTTKDLVVV